MKDLLQYRDGLYYLHTVKNEKEVAVFLDIYKYQSSETYSKLKSLKVVTVLLTNLTGICAGIVRDNRSEEGIKSFLIAVETRRSLNQAEYRLRIYRVEFESFEHTLPSSISSFTRCQLSTTSFKNKLTNHQFLPGPCLIWISNYSYISVFHCYNSKLFTSQISQENDVKFVLLQAQLVSSNDSRNGHEQILLVCQKLHRDSYQNYKTSLSIFILCYDRENLQIKGLQTISTDFFIPSEYENITCMTVFLHPSTMKETSLKCHTEKCASDFAILKRNCSIVTTNNQFLVFIEGYPKYCCQIPGLNYTKMFKITQYNPYSCCFVLQATNGICMVQKNNETGKISANIWDKATNAVFGDFLQNGECQMVILMKVLKNGSPSFIISDARNISDKNLTNPQLSNIEEALQRRLQLSQAAFNKVEESLRDKREILESAVSSLKLAQRSGELPACVKVPENLINFDKENIGVDSERYKFPKNDLDMCLKLLSQWNCVYVNNWTIGATFFNESNKEIQNITGIVTTEDQDLEFICKTFGHQIADIPCQPELKIMKSALIKPRQMISIVLSLQVPKMLTSTITANVIFTWSFENDQKLITQQLPIRTSINLEDIVSGQKLFELPITRRLMSLRATQELAELSLTSTNLSSNHLERILLENKGKKDFPDVYNFNEQTHYLFSDQISILFGLNFEIEVLSASEANLLVFAREENQLLVFVQWIYKELRNGFVLIPNENQKGQVREELYQAMKEELLCIERSLLNVDTDYSNLREPCKKVQKRTNEMISKWQEEESGINYEQYVKFRNTLLELEIITDNILAKILQ